MGNDDKNMDEPINPISKTAENETWQLIYRKGKTLEVGNVCGVVGHDWAAYASFSNGL